MNYIEQIRKFWQCNNERPIGCNATALYFYLLNINNSLGWKDTFRHSDRYIAIQLGISVNTVRTAKNLLAQLGLISFKAPQKKSKSLDGCTLYSLSTVLNTDTVPDTDVDTDADTVPDTDVDTDADTRDKLNKTKQENIESGCLSPPGENLEEQTRKVDKNDPPKKVVKKKEKSSAKKERKNFTPPSVDDVSAYCKENGYTISPWKFVNYYTSNGWMVGRTKMKDWQAAVRNWQSKEKEYGNKNSTVVLDSRPDSKLRDSSDFSQKDYSAGF